jgi:hypothetical protein
MQLRPIPTPAGRGLLKQTPTPPGFTHERGADC